ncbi:hypothetical protein PIB30_019753 [Stylosanthes scabra]|uniref:Transposase, Ptta/En/Spm, plant n=1 Tax=Stylosanthes scabra TaxID=79078 RepID=A0ABU6W829_9FABA|nr:hypothetical protein [Stylosanthes scabra]
MLRRPRYPLATVNDVVAAAQPDTNLVGTMKGGTGRSGVQPREVQKNTLSTGSGPRQATSKVRQFRPPRNEARPTHSTRAAVPQVPAARDISRSVAEMDDSDSEDPDYNPMADDVDSWDDHLDRLFEKEEVENRDTEFRRRDTDTWKVNVIAFPIHVRSWKKMTEYKEREYERHIKRYFHFEVDDKKAVKGMILTKLGKIWRDTRGRLFHKFYDETKSLDENVERRCPRGINPDHWRTFLKYPLEDDTLKKCITNTANRAKQLYTHVGDSKTLARRTEEEEKRHERSFSRGEMWTMVHKRRDGSYINEDAQVVGESIAEIESRDASTKELSQNDSLAQVLGKEHLGRIHEYQKQIAALEARTAEAEKKSQTMEHLIRFLVQRQGGDLPPEIAAEMNALGSGATTSDVSPSFETPEL